jgi:hypothetical protein
MSSSESRKSSLHSNERLNVTGNLHNNLEVLQRDDIGSIVNECTNLATRNLHEESFDMNDVTMVPLLDQRENESDHSPIVNGLLQDENQDDMGNQLVTSESPRRMLGRNSAEAAVEIGEDEAGCDIKDGNGTGHTMNERLPSDMSHKLDDSNHHHPICYKQSESLDDDDELPDIIDGDPDEDD